MHQKQDIEPLQQPAPFDLAFRIRAPRSGRPRGCVILLHGVGSSESSLAGLAGALPEDLLVVLARGPVTLGPEQYGWFRVAFTGEGPRIDANQADSSRRSLIRFVAQIQAHYGFAPRETLIGGFSQGGIMSAGVALSAPQRVGGFALLSGRILPELEPHLAPKADLARLQALICHGEHDSTLPPGWAQRADRWLHELGVPHQLRLYPIDHRIDASMQADVVAWIDDHL